MLRGQARPWFCDLCPKPTTARPSAPDSQSCPSLQNSHGHGYGYAHLKRGSHVRRPTATATGRRISQLQLHLVAAPPRREGEPACLTLPYPTSTSPRSTAFSTAAAHASTRYILAVASLSASAASSLASPARDTTPDPASSQRDTLIGARPGRFLLNGLDG